MWKFYYYPQWRFDLLEQYLDYMEANGYRLVYVSFLYFFKFQKSNPRKVHYLYSYSFLKESGMIDQDYQMRKKYNAMEIHSSFFFPTKVLRITTIPAPIEEFDEFRKKYLLHVLLQKLIFVLLFGVGILGGLFNHSGCTVMIIALFVWLGFLFYYLIGMGYMHHKCRS